MQYSKVLSAADTKFMQITGWNNWCHISMWFHSGLYENCKEQTYIYSDSVWI